MRMCLRQCLTAWWMAGWLAMAATAFAQTSAPDAGAPPGAAAGVASQADAAELRFMDRPIVTFRGAIAGASPAQRAARAEATLEGLPNTLLDAPIGLLQGTLGGRSVIAFRLQDRILFALTSDDIEPGDNRSLDAISNDVRSKLQVAMAARREQLHVPTIVRGVAFSVLATAVLALLVFGVGRMRTRLHANLQRALETRVLQRTVRGFDWAGSAFHLVHQIVQLLALGLILMFAYVYLIFVLGRFPATAPMGGRLSGFLWALIDHFALGTAAAIPGVITVIVIFLLTRALQSLINNIFDAIQAGRLTLPGMHPETAGATRRVVSVLLWGLALTFAYPYLPGAQSDVFKGLSVLLGLMVTLGSSGIVNQLMSGMVVIYSRALRKGDLVTIGDATGTVVGVDALSVKIVNLAQVEVTIPNAVVVGAIVRNYSSQGSRTGAALSTTVTIGYDTPWRQVHAMLTDAALRTSLIAAQPAPFVLQRALSDFYVEYELFAALKDPAARFRAVSELHGQIQDVFNEYGVQIMSPHFETQPKDAVVVSPDGWYPAPARPPAPPPANSAAGSADGLSILRPARGNGESDGHADVPR
ncbi:mechanosensitive ion channel protein [Pandoraea terrae]|uniref:Small-conductance mechanosensitive channel n=1 Tax=Pandoraea terrae TaxID=1537710 RepID=A0A5E4SA91_9BURK|nr:mechanosensitive ion channel domain-containing protein [Pandoraea terrae]VVD71993.1 mechanosensitive ion channel protein [Pandoraea terrae]